MKKLAILFLLTTVLIGGVFAQASVKADLRFQNVSGGNDGDLVPRLALIFAGSGSQEIGPGALSFGLQIAPTMNFTDKAAGAGMDLSGDDNFGDISYALAAGPGTLKIGLKILSGDMYAFTWKPHVDYDGIVAGPVTLGFGLWYDFKTFGFNDEGKASTFGKYDLKKTENKADEFGFALRAAFGFGLNVTYNFVYGIGAEEVAKIAYLDITYQVMDALVVGLELDDTGKDFVNDKAGFTLKPKAAYTLNENMAAGAYLIVNNILNDVDADLVFSPGVSFTYSM